MGCQFVAHSSLSLKPLISMPIPLPEAGDSSSHGPFRKWFPAPAERPTSGSAPRRASARPQAGPLGPSASQSGQAGKAKKS